MATIVAMGLNNLAALYQDTNRLNEAEPLKLRALEINTKSLGEDHPSTLTVGKIWPIFAKNSPKPKSDTEYLPLYLIQF